MKQGILKASGTNSRDTWLGKKVMESDWGIITRGGAIEHRLPILITVMYNALREPYFLNRKEQAILRKAHRNSVKIIHKA